MTTTHDSNTTVHPDPAAPPAQPAVTEEDNLQIIESSRGGDGTRGGHPNGRGTGAIEDESAREAGAPDRPVPVTQAIRYRKRAQVAERGLEEAQRQVAELRDQLAQAQRSIEAVGRRQRIDALLLEEGAIDLDAARLLAERAVEAMSEPDVPRAVEELKRRKPYLFPRGDGIAASIGAMAPRFDDEATPAEQAAQHAAETGDRRDLLAYLRLRRRS